MSTADSPADLAKTYDPTAVEAEAYRVWIDEQCFAADPAAPGEPYSVVIPPPNVTGACTSAMRSTPRCRTSWFASAGWPGSTRCGFPASTTPASPRRRLSKNSSRSRKTRPATMWGAKASSSASGPGSSSTATASSCQLQRALGCSVRLETARASRSTTCAPRPCAHTFFKLFKDGLIYRGKRLVNWDVFLQTSDQRRRDLSRDGEDESVAHATIRLSRTPLTRRRHLGGDASPPSPGTPGQKGGGGGFGDGGYSFVEQIRTAPKAPSLALPREYREREQAAPADRRAGAHDRRHHAARDDVRPTPPWPCIQRRPALELGHRPIQVRTPPHRPAHPDHRRRRFS